MRRSAIAVFGMMVLVGCGDNHSTTYNNSFNGNDEPGEGQGRQDSGVRPDSRSPVSPDSPVATPDSGAPPDSRLPVQPDSGPRPDARPDMEPDAGVPPDAGTQPDSSGTLPDSAPPATDSRSDAGTSPDAMRADSAPAGQPDLGLISVQPNIRTPAPGDAVTYSLDIVNHGSAVATGVTLDVTFEGGGVWFRNWTTNGRPVSCQIIVGGSLSLPRLSCALEDMPPNTVQHVVFDLTIPATATDGMVIAGRIYVNGQNEANFVDNGSDPYVVVESPPTPVPSDLWLRDFTATPVAPSVGGRVDYQITYDNVSGGETATGIVVTLSFNTSAVRLLSANATCSMNQGQVTCVQPDMVATAESVVVIGVGLDSSIGNGQTVDATACVTGNVDANSLNNCRRQQVMVVDTTPPPPPGTCVPVTREAMAGMIFGFQHPTQVACAVAQNPRCPDSASFSGRDLGCAWAVLQNQGLLDVGGGNCRPTDVVSRAEFLKVVITAFDGLAGYQAPAGPTFPDVAVDAWYFDYVEAAYQLNLVRAGADGLFHPADVADFCWANHLARSALVSIEPPPVTSGTLRVYNETWYGSYDGIAVAGSTMTVAQYRFRAAGETFTVDMLTVDNDLWGTAAFGDDLVDTPAVQLVEIGWSENGIWRTRLAAMNQGSATFTGLGMQVTTDRDMWVSVSPHFTAMQNYPYLSGLQVRLGLRNVNNTMSTFRATGQTSGAVWYDVPVLGNESLNAVYTVRKSRPYVWVDQSYNQQMSAGTNQLITAEVRADEAGDIALGRMVFDVTASGLGSNASVYNFRLMAGDSLGGLTDVVGANIYATRSDPGCSGLYVGWSMNGLRGVCPVGIPDGTFKVIVSLTNEQIVSRGTLRYYALVADVADVVTYGSVSTRLATGDQDTWPVTASIFSAIGPSLFGAGQDFMEGVWDGRNFVWSDMSSGALHKYPDFTFFPTMVVPDTGSFDWESGSRLDFIDLPARYIQM